MCYHRQRQVNRLMEARRQMPVKLTEIEQAEVDLEQWLVEQAENGVPEIVLIGLLRDYADDIEQLGYVPRTWGESD